jgi:hypothetical protein
MSPAQFWAIALDLWLLSWGIVTPAAVRKTAPESD